MDKSSVIFGNPMDPKTLAKAEKAKAGFLKKFGDDTNTVYHLGLQPIDQIPELGIQNLVHSDTPLELPENALIVGNIRMGFGHYRIAMAIASCARALGRQPIWFDLASFDATGSKMIRHQNDLYSMGSKLSQKVGLFNKLYWEPLNDHELVEGVAHDCAKRVERLDNGKPVRFLMTVGGAGAGGDLYLAMTKHLLPYIQAGKAELWINFGDHLTMWDVFKRETPELKQTVKTYFDDYAGLKAWAAALDGDSPAGITAFCHRDIFEAVYSTNLLMRKCDVLVTKPSELAFYPVPKLMMRHIGGHEVYGAVHAQELGDSTFECETAPALADMIDTLINDKAILKHMCGRIVQLKNQGVYNGGYEVVKLAINGRP